VNPLTPGEESVASQNVSDFRNHCKNCRLLRWEHGDDGKCFFESTYFEMHEYYAVHLPYILDSLRKYEAERAAFLALPWYKRLWTRLTNFVDPYSSYHK
jgi:hypothetical protein